MNHFCCMKAVDRSFVDGIWFSVDLCWLDESFGAFCWLFCSSLNYLVLRAAMMRRAVANKGLTRYVQAKQDLEVVLEKEANNKQASVGIFIVDECHLS